MSKHQVAKKFSIPESKLQRYLKKLTNNQMATVGYAQHGKMFNDEMENDLAQNCVNLVRVHPGLSPEKGKQLAFEFVFCNNLKISQSLLKNRKAGRRWFTYFF